MGSLTDFFQSIIDTHDAEMQRDYPVVVFAFPDGRQERFDRTQMVVPPERLPDVYEVDGQPFTWRLENKPGETWVLLSRYIVPQYDRPLEITLPPGSYVAALKMRLSGLQEHSNCSGMDRRSVFHALMQTEFRQGRITRIPGEFLCGVDRTRAKGRRYFDIGNRIGNDITCPKCRELIDRYHSGLFEVRQGIDRPVGVTVP